VNVEQETALLIIDRQAQVLLVLNHLPLTAGEIAALPLPDAILKRPPFSSHRPSEHQTPSTPVTGTSHAI
jgi:hypothetical protein